ncbi:type I restriction endonuclease subunit R [[Mycoplasma] anseris]|uniref:Type I restriction enzyme endonuclease subunit n=1 Tax=[Mycoplasma] anseris TaxID=92400 RepID=A0A2Z4NDI8_9BACT|nr:type I restriction endonuclease subunit R [[Mycoplasma] anseris]AWX69651.1 type I restriction endonuclease subunit R [[Mycoplasma] anseris]
MIDKTKDSNNNQVSAIAEMNNGIILTKFKKENMVNNGYQSEADLEAQLIEQLQKQGYQKLEVSSLEQLQTNLRIQIERLNQIHFSDDEWNRFNLEYLNTPNDGVIEKTRKVQEDYVYNFVFDDNTMKNIKIIDKTDINNNFLQVANQIQQQGLHLNRYDVTILVNGLPLVHIELKKRGINIKEAFNQIQRYSKESFNINNSLYKYVQIFVISNGTSTRYFANTTAKNKNSYEFTSEWADARNEAINDLDDFTKTFFEKRVLLEILTKYCVFDTQNNLLIMRPYQIAATERILWKINSSYANNMYGKREAGGFIWHATGSGKTLTSFKTAKLASSLSFIDKVFFIVDRKDLDYQTMKEYQKFDPDSVTSTKNTSALKKSIEENDNRIIVTTIQKLNKFVSHNPTHPIYNKHCVLIYDECHRSQFGVAQRNIQRKFKKYYQFGFTGTPIFVENSLGGETTSGIFGAQLHSYVITNAIKDKKVLKFKVDYINLNPEFKDSEQELDIEKLIKLDKDILIHPKRIEEICKHILKVFDTKTHRNVYYDLNKRRINGFNAMFAVENIKAAKIYYETLEKLQSELPEEQRLRIATIFTFNPNENQIFSGEIGEENFDPETLDITSREFLENVIANYNHNFNTNFSTDEKKFENYYKDISLKMKNKEIDLLIVVGMFLTGFDAPMLNTLFVDKNLRYHGLIQAFSRTNRILNAIKAFGNVVCFRDLETATKDAIKTFGDKNSLNVILEKSYQDYMNGFKDEATGEFNEGYKSVCNKLLTNFPDPTQIQLDTDKKIFIKTFGDFLKLENILRNFDDFKESNLSERQIQDYRSIYLQIKEEVNKKRESDNFEKKHLDFANLEFHLELMKTDEINLDFILQLILEKTQGKNFCNNKNLLKEEIRRILKSSLGTRAKEEIVIEFIEITDFSEIKTKDEILERFYLFAKNKKEDKIAEVVKEERLKNDLSQATDFIKKSINKGYVVQNGEDFDKILPPISRIKGERERKKEAIFKKLQKIVEEFFEI